MPWHNEHVMVLGADGFLGQHMVRILRDRGATVHSVGKAAGDFSDWPTVEAVFRSAPSVTKIIHLITRQRTGQVQYGIQGELLAINARIHLNVLEAWRQFQPQAKLISTGSSCAFPEMDRPIVEGDFQSGRMHDSVRGYGLAKQMLAVGSEAYASQYGLKYLHMFLATVYGPNDHRAIDRTHFMTGMIHRAVAEKHEGKTEMTVWGEPDTVRDLLYVDDQIDAMLVADQAFENVYLNCSANVPVTIDECAQAIRKALDWEAKIVYPSGTFKGAGYKTLDASEFLQKTNWKPVIGLEQGVSRIIVEEYYKN